MKLEKDEKWILVFGNPIEGFTFVGPFEDDDPEEACAFAESCETGDWWLGTLVDSTVWLES